MRDSSQLTVAGLIERLSCLPGDALVVGLEPQPKRHQARPEPLEFRLIAELSESYMQKSDLSEVPQQEAQSGNSNNICKVVCLKLR